MDFEQMSTNDFITVEIGEFIKNKEHKFYWIPYYMSNGYSQWKDYGFDIAYLQPNYFFNKKIVDERLRNASELAFTHNMGMEMEFDSRALFNSKENLRERLLKYITVFKEKNVFSNSSIVNYEGGGGIYKFSQSSHPKDKEIIDILHSLIFDRRAKNLENIVYQQNFKKEKFIDEIIWTNTCENSNIKFSANGLEISSIGNTAKLNTFRKLNMKYGRIELTAKIVSKDCDTKIKFHLLPTEYKSGNWPSSGELFLMCFDGSKPEQIRVGVNTDQMNVINGKIRDSVLDWGNQYNQTHSFIWEWEWEEKMITFYIDGMKVNIQEDLFEKQYSNYINFWPFNEAFYFEIIESIKISKSY